MILAGNQDWLVLIIKKKGGAKGKIYKSDTKRHADYLNEC